MNYILQLNAFWEWADVNYLSPNEIALYLKLLGIANKTGWKQRFPVPNGVLSMFNKTTLVRTREKLAERGLITYIKGKKGQAPLYGIAKLYGSDAEELNGTEEVYEESEEEAEEVPEEVPEESAEDDNIGTQIGTQISTKNDTENNIDAQIGTHISTQIGTHIGTQIGTHIGFKNDHIHKHKQNINETKTNNIYPLTPTPSDVVDLFNRVCLSFPKVTRLSDARLRTIKARLKKYSIGEIEEAFKKAEQSDFLKGTNSRGWRADFDWLMKEGNIAKVLDGNYDNFTPVKEGFDPYTDNFDHKTLEELTRRMPT